MRTTEIINEALEVMNGQDWYWYLSDYQVAEMKDKAIVQCVTLLNWLLLSVMQQ